MQPTGRPRRSHRRDIPARVVAEVAMAHDRADPSLGQTAAIDVARREFGDEEYTHDAVKKAWQRIEHGIVPHPGKPGCPKLTPEEDVALTFFMIQMAKAGIGLDKSDVKVILEGLHRNVTDHGYDQWWSHFKSSHQDVLIFRHGKKASVSRVASEQRKQVDMFITLFKEFSGHEKLGRSCVVNMDSTSLRLKDETTVLGPRGTPNVPVVGSRSQEVGSMVTFRDATGAGIMSVFLLKGNEVTSDDGTGLIECIMDVSCLAERAHESRHSHPIFFMFSSTGVLTQPLFKQVVTKFEELFHARSPGLDCLLLVDGNSAHKDKKTWITLFMKGVNIFVLPPNTTAWFQPLDVGYFNVLKRVAKKILNKSSREAYIAGQRLDHLQLKAFLEAIDEIDRQTWSKLADVFKKVGLWPFDEKRIRELAWDNTGGDLADIGADSHTMGPHGDKMMNVIDRKAQIVASGFVAQLKAPGDEKRDVRRTRMPRNTVMCGRQAFIADRETKRRKLNEESQAKLEKDKKKCAIRLGCQEEEAGQVGGQVSEFVAGGKLLLAMQEGV